VAEGDTAVTLRAKPYEDEQYAAIVAAAERRIGQWSRAGADGNGPALGLVPLIYRFPSGLRQTCVHRIHVLRLGDHFFTDQVD
jgi:hypothetical protein